MTTPQERLSELEKLITDARAEQQSCVAQVLAAGGSWRDVGDAVGLDRRSAWARWGRKKPDIEDLPLSDPLFDPLFKTPQD